MSGATGAGSAGTSGTGTEGARGSATDAPDSHESHGSQGGTVTDTRGRTGADTDGGGGASGGRAGDGAAGSRRDASGGGAAAGGGSGSGASGKRAGDGASGALPGERQPQQNNQPYHPPQAYQAAPAGAVRRPRTGARTTPRTRKARLRVAKADPWSVMKVSFLLSIALGICTIVAAAVLWMVMDAMGVFSTVGGTISEATGSNESNGFDLQAFLSLPRVLIFTSIIAVIDVVLATALATLGAFIYNLSAGFVGGIELTLAEDE
ncbi:DUF3566 domain-containing protein [Streptomyces flavofungini]|uniref:DUF3566 domain-containing protein n=1 Tax=Streptomyces flavofungini TaxID=68200 RepID=A0ABS0WYA7_9ACTN|nr:DUF3566 domain-containing protein [Streptomyces flavofungini]MBJ3805920.1 DUF3566 domain-containing protein [Streptomyces flavofungini]GHC76034.1 hypothetical protein GCM10010349_55710 [Streptomyces flavofungini]